METHISFTFRVRFACGTDNVESHDWLNSAGRWLTMQEAANAAASWLVATARRTVQQYSVEVISVEELDLLNG